MAPPKCTQRGNRTDPLLPCRPGNRPLLTAGPRRWTGLWELIEPWPGGGPEDPGRWLALTRGPQPREARTRLAVWEVGVGRAGQLAAGASGNRPQPPGSCPGAGRGERQGQPHVQGDPHLAQCQVNRQMSAFKGPHTYRGSWSRISAPPRAAFVYV